MELIDKSLFEYKDIQIDTRRKDVYLTCIKNFGWQLVASSESDTKSNVLLKRELTEVELKDAYLEQTLDTVMRIKYIEDKDYLSI